MNKQAVKKIWNGVTFTLLGIVVLIAIALVGVKIFGIEPYVVLSGSMEPELPTGSLIYVTKTDPATLKEGHIITFRLDGDTVVTHRIVEVLEENGQRSFRTKGDANDVEDSVPVTAGQLLGVPLFSLPGLGYLTAYITSPAGRYITIAVCLFLLLLLFLPDIIFGKDTDKKHTKKENPQ